MLQATHAQKRGKVTEKPWNNRQKTEEYSFFIQKNEEKMSKNIVYQKISCTFAPANESFTF